MRRPKPTLRTVLFAAVLLALAATLPAAGQAPPSPFTEIGQKAAELAQGGDVPGALAVLEPAYRDGTLNDVEKALYGTLLLEAGRPGDAAAVLGPLADREDADPAVLYNAGRAAMALGFMPAAERYLARSVSLMPRSPAVRELGLLWGAAGRSFDAYRLLRPWALANPGDFEARVAAAALALRLERESEAAELIDGLAETNPKVRMLRAQTLLHQAKPEDALAILEPLFEDHPPEMHLDVLRLLADVNVSLGRSQEAIDLIEKTGVKEPRLALILSTAYYRQGEVDKALAALEPYALEVPKRRQEGEEPGPLDPKLAFEYGRLLVSARRAEEAVPMLRAAVGIMPDNAPAWKSLGDALLAAGRRDEALEARKKFRDMSALENERRREEQGERSVQDPTERSLIRAKKALDDGDPQTSLEILHREMALRPRDMRLYLMEVTTLLKLERPEDALKRAEWIVERFPGQPDAVYQRGVVKLAIGETEAAEKDLRQALELYPEHAAALNDLAVILMVRGEKAEAEALLERVLAVHPDDETARRNLEKLRQDSS